MNRKPTRKRIAGKIANEGAVSFPPLKEWQMIFPSPLPPAL